MQRPILEIPRSLTSYLVLLTAFFLASCNKSNDSTSITSETPGWGTAILLETTNESATFPRIAVDGSGNAIAVWQQTDATTERISIWANRYIADTGWETAQLLETDDTGDAVGPQIALDPNGNGLAVWQQSDGTRTNIWAKHFTAGTTSWGTTDLIESDNTGDAVTPQVALDPNGNGIAVWRQFDGTQYHIMANIYTAGAGWGTAQTIESNSGDALAPQIALDSTGNGIAVWRQADGSQINVWANRYAAGVWDTPRSFIPTDTVTTDTGDAAVPQIALDPDGDGLVVWQQQQTLKTPITNPPNDVWAIHYDATTATWDTTPHLLETATGNAINPQIAADASGNGLAVWQQLDGARYHIWANRYTASATSWGTAVLIETNNPGTALVPQIAMNDAGKGIAIWEQTSGARTTIWVNRYAVGTGGTGWGTALRIQTNSDFDAFVPQIAIDPNDHGIAVWEQFDTTNLVYNIWANRSD